MTTLHEAAQKPKLDDIEQYRMQMAGISTAAIGYWKEGDAIHPDYDTVALRDVAKLYAKYAALAQQGEPVIDYTVLHQFADDQGISYNKLCTVVRMCLTAAPAPQAQQQPVAYEVSGPYERQVFKDASSAEAWCSGLNAGYGSVAYSIAPLYRVMNFEETRTTACLKACANIPTYQLAGEDGEPIDLGATIDALREAAPQAQQEPVAWQPIETAPKDGSMVDLWVRPFTGQARRFCGYWWLESDGVWRTGEREHDVPRNWTATHWMPLPPAPGAAPQPAIQERKPLTVPQRNEINVEMTVRRGFGGESIGYLIDLVIDNVEAAHGITKGGAG